MGLLSKLRHKASDKVIDVRTYRARDDHGTRHDTLDKAAVYWMTRMTSVKKDPFVMHTFDRAEDARAALLELPCIHVAEDTGNLICTEVLIYGYWPTEEKKYEAMICGADLAHELWELARQSFELHGGRLKNQLEPERRASAPQSKPSKQQAKPEAARYVREERQQKMGQTFIYRIHKAPSSASAMAFLEQNPVTKQLLYLIVETPDGNYCRDIQGIYKE